jgi:hypothetical protein
VSQHLLQLAQTWPKAWLVWRTHLPMLAGKYVMVLCSGSCCCCAAAAAVLLLQRVLH